MSPKELTQRFPQRILIVGDYDWNDFETLNREINRQLHEAQPMTGEFLDPQEFQTYELSDQELDQNSEVNDTLFIVPDHRGAAAMARGIANHRQLPVLEIETEWLKKKHKVNEFNTHEIIANLKPTKILNFDRSRGQSPAWKTFIHDLVELAKSQATPVHLIAR